MSDNESSQSRERGTATKRGRYVSNACESCQKRKVKCTGVNPCQQCQLNDLGCTYSKGKKRRRMKVVHQAPADNQIPQAEAAPQPNEPPYAVATQPELSSSLSPILNRIADLERVYHSLRSRLNTSGEWEHYQSPQSTATTSRPDQEAVIPLDEGFRGPTNMLELIRMLNQTVAGWEQPKGMPEDGVLPEHSPTNHWDWHDPATERTGGIDVLNREARIHDIAQLQHAVDIFFAEINPMFPCLNETQFRRQLQDALENGAAEMSRPDRYQFFALLHLIQAEIDLMTVDWRPEDPIPGWKSILRAESILSRLLWQGNGNLLTLQCYVVKTRYFFYLERGGAAHETITRAVRLCFQLGLHDQDSWGDVPPFERLMRQRVFWTIAQLERSLSLNNGFPYLIRETEVSVDLPGCFDERQLAPDQPLPSEDPDSSYGPTVAVSAKWGSLVSELWDSMYAVRSKKAVSPEYIAGLDARIVYILGTLPPGLQLPAPALSPSSVFEVNSPRFFDRHAAIVHLRFHQLRLLLHQKSLLSFSYEETVASTCLFIIREMLRIIQSYLERPSRVFFRFIAVFHIVVTLVPLVCLIVHNRNPTEIRAEAISCFKAELSILQDLTPTFGMARHVLRRLRALIASVKRTMQELAPDPNTAALIHPSPTLLSVNQPHIDPASDASLAPTVDTSMLDSILGDFTLPETSFPPNDLTSIWTDDLLTYQWTMPTELIH